MTRRHAWLGVMLAATILATWLAAGVEEEGAAAALLQWGHGPTTG